MHRRTRNPVRSEAPRGSADRTRGQKNQVIEILQKGYSLNGKVIRTAKVKISS